MCPGVMDTEGVGVISLLFAGSESHYPRIVASRKVDMQTTCSENYSI